MPVNKNLLKILPAFIIFDVLLFDLVSKYFADKNLYESYPILPGIFEFTLHKNTGVAFSLPVPIPIQILLTFVLLFLLLRYYQTHKKGMYDAIAFGLVAGGALGNLAERILFGAVTDFIAVWKFPVFNIADSAIFLGVVLFLVREYFQQEKIKS